MPKQLSENSKGMEKSKAFEMEKTYSFSSPTYTLGWGRKEETETTASVS
jgi:hypothetical protein